MDVVGYAHKGDLYCIPCAREQLGIVDENGNFTEDNGGPVFRDTETDTYYHCGYGKQCLNAVEANNFKHLTGDHMVGDRIDETVLSVFPYGPVVYPHQIEYVTEPLEADLPLQVFHEDFHAFGEIVERNKQEDTVTVSWDHSHPEYESGEEQTIDAEELRAGSSGTIWAYREKE